MVSNPSEYDIFLQIIAPRIPTKKTKSFPKNEIDLWKGCGGGGSGGCPGMSSPMTIAPPAAAAAAICSAPSRGWGLPSRTHVGWGGGGGGGRDDGGEGGGGCPWNPVGKGTHYACWGFFGGFDTNPSAPDSPLASHHHHRQVLSREPWGGGSVSAIPPPPLRKHPFCDMLRSSALLGACAT